MLTEDDCASTSFEEESHDTRVDERYEIGLSEFLFWRKRAKVHVIGTLQEAGDEYNARCPVRMKTRAKPC